MVKLKEVAAPPPAPLAATVADEAAAASSAAGDWEQSPDGLKCAPASRRQGGGRACLQALEARAKLHMCSPLLRAAVGMRPSSLLMKVRWAFVGQVQAALRQDG